MVLIKTSSPGVGVMNETENSAQPTAWTAPRIIRLGAAQTADNYRFFGFSEFTAVSPSGYSVYSYGPPS